MSTRTEYFPSGADVGALVIDMGGLFIRAGNAGTHMDP